MSTIEINDKSQTVLPSSEIPWDKADLAVTTSVGSIDGRKVLKLASTIANAYGGKGAVISYGSSKATAVYDLYYDNESKQQVAIETSSTKENNDTQQASAPLVDNAKKIRKERREQLLKVAQIVAQVALFTLSFIVPTPVMVCENLMYLRATWINPKLSRCARAAEITVTAISMIVLFIPHPAAKLTAMGLKSGMSLYKGYQALKEKEYLDTFGCVAAVSIRIYQVAQDNYMFRAESVESAIYYVRWANEKVYTYWVGKAAAKEAEGLVEMKSMTTPAAA